jgi:hypothetical protein
LIRLDGSFAIANPSVGIAGPVSVPLTPGTSQTEFTANLSVEGTYTITASALGSDGRTYSDSVTVTVISRSQLDNLLKAKWETMRSALATGDVTSTVANFSEL